ncbi:MAG: hypothetical protein RLZZ488_898 [Pseudomonadota bacterium]
MEREEKSDEIFEGLEDGSLIGCFFESCTFRRCKFIGRELRNCRFIDCTFENCDFSVATVTGSSFRNATFKDCKAIGVNWSKSAGIHSAKFHQCKLNDSSFTMVDMRGTLFEDCLLEGVDFRETRLEKSKFPNCRMNGAQFNKTNLVDTDFSQANGYFFDPRENRLKNTKVSLPEAMGLLESLGAVLTIHS